eukprot:8470079-Alexandrium_andersonii.AAC.1
MESDSTLGPASIDGVLWCVKWELAVDRSGRVVPENKTDQWLQEERGVRLVALWIRGAPACDL